jgi:hypothetical protein
VVALALYPYILNIRLPGAFTVTAVAHVNVLPAPHEALGFDCAVPWVIQVVPPSVLYAHINEAGPVFDLLKSALKPVTFNV